MSAAVRIGRWLVAALWLIELVMLVTGWAALQPLMSVLLAVCVILVLPTTRAGTRRLSVFLLATGAAVAWWSGGIAGALGGLEFATAFPAFLASMTLLRATALVHPKVAQVRQAVARLSARDRENGFTLAAHFLGAVVTAGTFGILAPLAPDGLDEPERRSLALACLRGANLAVLWSPFFVGAAVVARYLPDVPAWQIFVVGAGLAALAFAIAAMAAGREGLRGIPGAMRALAPVLPSVIVLAALIVTVSLALGTSTLHTVFLTVPPITALFLATQPKGTAAIAARSCWDGLVHIREELVVVSSVSVFSMIIAGSPSIAAVAAGILDIGLPAPLLMLSLLASMIAVAMLGIHPMATISVTLALLTAGSTPLSAYEMTALGLLAWGLGTMVSPGSITVLTSSNLFAVEPLRLILSRNLVFVAVFGTLACLVVTALF